MQVQVAETGPCSRTLHVTVSPELVQQHLDQMVQSAQQQVQMRGFRPGKVPRHIVQKKFGPAILAEAKEQLLNRYFGEACRENEINPVGRVAIDDFEQLEVVPGSALTFTAKVDVKPTFELKGMDGLTVEKFEGEATDADIDNALKEIAHQKRTIQPASDAAADGDFVKCDYTFLGESGEEVHGKKGVQLNTRIPIHGVEDEAYTKALVGLAAGKQVEVEITFPDNFEKAEVRGKKGKVRIDAKEILRVTPPPLDDALAKTLEFESMAALRADLANRIGAEKQRLGRLRQEDECLQHLLAANVIPLPPSLVEEQKIASLNAFAQRLQQNGASDDEIRKKLDESDVEAQGDAERRVRMFFLIEAVARKQKLFVAESDVEQELRHIAVANSSPEQQISAAQIKEHLERENRLGELRLALLERKVRDFLRENARQVDKTAG
jgi:trigger factor